MLSALKLLQQNGYLTLTDEMANPARIMFCVSRDDLYKIRVARDDLDHFIRTLLRLYEGVFNDFRPIDEGEIARWSGYTPEHVRELLKRLWRMRVLRYIPANRSPILFFNEERLPVGDLYIAPETYLRRKELVRERFEQMRAYAADTETCRSAFLERYFGEKEPRDCGVCDCCLARKREARRAERGNGDDDPAAEGLREELLSLLAAEPLSPAELARRCRRSPETAAAAIDALLAEGKISLTEEGKLTIKR